MNKTILGDKLILNTEDEEYSIHNGKEVEVVGLIGADSGYEACVLPLYRVIIDDERLDLSFSEFKPKNDVNIDDSPLKRYFNKNSLIDDKLIESISFRF
jgi:hypothetical protein